MADVHLAQEFPAIRATSRLFIGGSQDGKRHDVADDRHFFIFEQPVAKSWDCFEMTREVYLAMPFAGDSRRFELFVLEGMSADDLIERLIQGYNPKAAVIDAVRKCGGEYLTIGAVGPFICDACGVRQHRREHVGAVRVAPERLAHICWTCDGKYNP